MLFYRDSLKFPSDLQGPRSTKTPTTRSRPSHSNMQPLFNSNMELSFIDFDGGPLKRCLNELAYWTGDSSFRSLFPPLLPLNTCFASTTRREVLMPSKTRSNIEGGTAPGRGAFAWNVARNRTHPDNDVLLVIALRLRTQRQSAMHKIRNFAVSTPWGEKWMFAPLGLKSILEACYGDQSNNSLLLTKPNR